MYDLGTPDIILVDDDEVSNYLSEKTIGVDFPNAVIKSFIKPLEALDYIRVKYTLPNPNKTILLLDINMPELCGWTFLEIIKNYPEEIKKQLAIYVISSSISHEDKFKANSNPLVLGFIKKPLLMYRVAIADAFEIEIADEKENLGDSKLGDTKIFNLSLISVYVNEDNYHNFIKDNSSFIKMLGYTKASIAGKTLYELIHQDDRQKTMDIIFSRERENFRKANFENRFLFADGTFHLLKWFFHSQSAKGIIQYSIVNTSNLEQIEDANRQTINMYNGLLNASPDGIFILDMKYKITDISCIVLEIFGYEDKNEFIGADFLKYIPISETEKMKTVLLKTESDGLVQNAEFILAKRNGSDFYCELNTTLIQETNGKPKSYMLIIRDISQRKKIEQQFFRTEQMVNVGEMASAMAHEINQPLLSITLGLENLLQKIQKSDVLDESYFHNKSEKIFEDIQRIGRIIDHVRAFSKDKDNIIPTLFSINESIISSASLILEQFAYDGIILNMKLADDINPILGNTYRFEQIILNLLKNARDALNEKFELSKVDFDKSILVRTYKNESKTYIEIKDNGIGIKPENIDRIMLPFFTTKESCKGTGLGLSVSYSIIKELNGEFEVESIPLNGTTFRIVLPITNTK